VESAFETAASPHTGEPHLTAHKTNNSVASTQAYLERLMASGPADLVKIHASMKHGDQSKYISVHFDTAKYKSIELVAITDVQFGHLSCNVARFLEFRDWILSVPNRFVLLLGDLVDAATAISVASPYENTEEPKGQVFRFVELCLPMRHRVIGYVGGNHERRSIKTFGDLGSLIATLLRVPYSNGKQFVDVFYGEHRPFKNSLWHGGTGSRTKGAKAQMLHRFMAQGDSQLYWVGHLHDVVVLYDWRERRRGKQIKLEKFAGVMSSSFLEHYGTYAEVMGMAPSDTMMARVILYPDGKWELTLR
jgi:UDP-2,3-diacylglucosamine pyrophosphatase LpxH